MANLSLRNVDDDFLTDLRDFTGKGASSQALIEAGHIAIKERKWRKRLQDQLDDAQREIQRYEQLVASLDGLCRQVREITGQNDMFNDSPDKVKDRLDDWIDGKPSHAPGGSLFPDC